MDESALKPGSELQGSSSSRPQRSHVYMGTLQGKSGAAAGAGGERVVVKALHFPADKLRLHPRLKEVRLRMVESSEETAE